MTTRWTDEMNDLLRVLHEAGDSFGFMAEALNREFGVNLTRNAIIGRSHRLGLIRREKGKPGHIVTKRRRSTPFRPKLTPSPPYDFRFVQVRANYVHAVVNLPSNQSPCAVTFKKLAHRHCRWPIDVPDQPIMYCGANHVEGAPYCLRHYRIAYQSVRKWAA